MLHMHNSNDTPSILRYILKPSTFPPIQFIFRYMYLLPSLPTTNKLYILDPPSNILSFFKYSFLPPYKSINFPSKYHTNLYNTLNLYTFSILILKN